MFTRERRGNSSTIHTDSLYLLLIFVIACLYALLLANIIPVDGTIKDRLNYLTYAGESQIIFARYISQGYLAIFTNEPIWLAINISLNSVLEKEQVVRVIVFFSAFVSSYHVLKVNPRNFIFLIFLLLIPAVISKYVVHIRQGLAISLFLTAWFTVDKKWRNFLFLLTPFIHSAFFFVLFLYYFTLVTSRLRFAFDLRALLMMLVGGAVGLGLGVIASALGARQANVYEFETAAVSGIGFIFWLGVFFLYYLEGEKFTTKHSFVMTTILFYLSTYFLIEVTGRIFESLVVVVLLASIDLSSWRREAFFGAIISFVTLSWLIRLNSAWLGWGV